MIENFLHTLGVGIIVVSMTISSWLGITPQIGAILPTTVANFETSLASAITSTDTSLTLTANAVRGGGSLSGYTCFTLDSGTSSDENVCGTLSGTAMTSITRGISYANGTTTVSENKFAHRRGASVKQSDAPLLLIMKAQLNGEDTIPNALTLDAIATYSSALSFATQSNQLASVKYSEDYANAVIAGGTPTSTEVFGGKVELGTLAEQASSYDGGSAKPTVLQTKNSTSTPGTPQSVAAKHSIIASASGYLAQAWLNLTEAFTWTGIHTHSANVIITEGNKMGIGTTTPYAPLSVYGEIVGSYFTATSTTATSTLTNMSISNNASTTNLFVSGTTVGGPGWYTGSSTNFVEGTFTGAIPSSANQGHGWYSTNDGGGIYNSRKYFSIFRTGLTVLIIEDRYIASTAKTYRFTLSWSGNDLIVAENADTDNDGAVAGTVYWYK